PAHRLPDVTERQIDILLSKYHVSGKISWRSYAQAGQIHKLHHTHRMAEDEISRVTGLSKKGVKDLLATYEVMTKNILPKLPGSKGLKKFSHVYEFFKNPGLDKFRGTPKNVTEFANWVADGKIKKGTDVRELPTIVKRPDALNT